MSFTKEAYKKLNQNKEGVRFIRPIGEYTLNEIIEALTELEELKSWKNELYETIDNLINKTKHWEEKEIKTEFEKGIARGYKTMLHQLLTDIDEEEIK